MPATAGRVRMPANNRVHSSAALQTHGIWQSAIGYDPYAPDQKDKQGGLTTNHTASSEQNAYDSFQGLLALARLTSSTADEARGACKKCGRVGHLTFQCRNFLTLTKEDVAAAAAAFERDRAGEKGGKDSEISSDEEDDSSDDESDSDEDSEMERVIAARMGKSVKTSKSRRGVHAKTHHSSRKSSSRKRKSEKATDHSSDDESDDDDLSDLGEVKGKKSRTESRKSSSKTRRSRKHEDLSCEESDCSSDHKERRSRKRRRRRRERQYTKSGVSSKRKRSTSEVEIGDSDEDAAHPKLSGKSRKEDYLNEHGKKHKTKSDIGHVRKQKGNHHKYERDKDQSFLKEDHHVHRDKADRSRNEKYGHNRMHSSGDYQH